MFKLMRQLMILFISIKTLISMGSCSLQNRFDDFDEITSASIMNTQKNCHKNDECEVINSRCCSNKEEFLALNIEAAKVIASMREDECNESQKKTCKAASNNYLTATCKNGFCELDYLSPGFNQSACESDAHCVAVEKDCCNNKNEYIAVNIRFAAEQKNIKFAQCKKKLQQEPKLCQKANQSRKSLRSVRAKCIEKNCEIK